VGAYGKSQSELVKKCAADFAVTTRTVRNWRDARDSRWLDFLASAALGATTAPPAPGTPASAIPEIHGTGIEFEIIRLKSECLDLSRRLATARGDLETEFSLSRMLDAKRETLRRLEKDNPDIQAVAGDVVKKTVLIQYAAQVVTLIRTLPARIASLVPDTLAADTRHLVAAEVDAICALAADIRPDEAA